MLHSLRDVPLLKSARLGIALAILLAACSGGAKSTALPATSTDNAPTKAVAEEWVLDDAEESMVLGSDMGTRVKLVPIRSTNEPSSSGHYFLQATGSKSEFDGTVVIVKKRRTDFGVQWVAQLRGEPFYMLQRDEGHSTWTFRGYGYDDGVNEKLESMAGTVDGRAIAKFRKEQASLPHRKIEASTRAEKEDWQEAELQSFFEDYSTCGDVPISIDWSTVDDAWFGEFSVANSCNTMVQIVGTLCNQHASAGDTLQKRLSFVCAFDGHPDARKKGRFERKKEGVFAFTPGIDGIDAIDPMISDLRHAVGENVQVLRNGDQHFIVKYDGKDGTTLFTGDETTFYPAATTSSIRPDFFSLHGELVEAEMRNSKGEWALYCGFKRAPLELLLGADRQRVIAAASFKAEAKWKREPYFLSRDSRGSYYYVDRYKAEFGGKRYRVFVGRRGQLKLTSLRSLVEDSEGTLFSTDSGDLRLIVNSGTRSASWIRGRKTTELTPVSLRRNKELIYDELGVYYGENFGFVCN